MIYSKGGPGSGRYPKGSGTKTFSSQDESHQWATENIKNSFTREQEASIKNYTSGGFYSINDDLRNGRVPYDKADYENIKSAFEESKESFFVSRTVSSDVLNNLEIGDDFTDLGFVSTTISPEFIYNKRDKTATRTKILIPKGTRVLYAQNVTAIKNEYEVLIDSGYKFRVKSKSVVNDVNEYTLELIIDDK